MEILATAADTSQIATGAYKTASVIDKAFPSRGQILKNCKAQQAATLTSLEYYLPYVTHSEVKLNEWRLMFDQFKRNAGTLADQYNAHTRLKKERGWLISRLCRWQNRESAEILQEAIEELSNRVGEATNAAVCEKIGYRIVSATESLKVLDATVKVAQEQLIAGNLSELDRTLEDIIRNLAKAHLPDEDAVNAYVQAKRQMNSTTCTGGSLQPLISPATTPASTPVASSLPTNPFL